MRSAFFSFLLIIKKVVAIAPLKIIKSRRKKKHYRIMCVMRSIRNQCPLFATVPNFHAGKTNGRKKGFCFCHPPKPPFKVFQFSNIIYTSGGIIARLNNTSHCRPPVLSHSDFCTDVQISFSFTSEVTRGTRLIFLPPTTTARQQNFYFILKKTIGQCCERENHLCV